MRTIRRFILNITGWRRRELHRVRLSRKWDALCRKEGELKELLSLENCKIVRAYLQWELHRNEVEMMLFREANQ